MGLDNHVKSVKGIIYGGISYSEKDKEYEYIDDYIYIIVPLKQFRVNAKQRAYRKIKQAVEEHLDCLQYTKQLERCPFCDSPATMERDKDRWYRAKCNECFVGQQWHPDPILQVQSWNSRTFAIPFTNGWKYKTAEEREHAYFSFCKGQHFSCKQCRLNDKNDGLPSCAYCQFRWLEQEAEDDERD